MRYRTYDRIINAVLTLVMAAWVSVTLWVAIQLWSVS